MTQLLQAKAAEWNVGLEEIRETATSLLGFGVREGTPVVLKLTVRADDELNAGKVLRAYGGRGAVRVLESEAGAVLLEQLEPGEQLVSVVRNGDDDEATNILADVIEKLADHSPPIECPTVADWGRCFDRYTQRTSPSNIPDELVREAQLIYNDLATSQQTTMLLHGDLQHYNVLFDNDRGWVAIDPKGVIGELEYEVGALLRNPVEQPELFTNPATIERRLQILTSRLPLDHTRVVRWAFAQAILSAIWDIEDGYSVKPNHPALLLGHTLRDKL